MNMGEPFDVYTDSFAVTVNPWGANLNLFLSQAQLAALEGSRVHCVGTVRMSNEYLKVLAYMLSQRISEHEVDNEVNYDVPSMCCSSWVSARKTGTDSGSVPEA